ncbi:MAG: outer membrane protein assembly factor [Deltaproteobacteria bacterium]|nr:MAG: outer membrane protein assembly factor [Deltaproteobacteria bacterium]
MGSRVRSALCVAALLLACSTSMPLMAEAGLERGSPAILGIELRLPPGVDPKTVRPFVSLRPGQPLTRRGVRRLVRLLYETGRFRQVRVYARREDEGVHLSVVLLPRQRLAEVSFFGNIQVSDEELARATGLSPGDEVRQKEIEEAARRVQARLTEAGFRSGSVVPELRESPDGWVALAFRIAEGPRTRLAGTRYEGDPALPAPYLDSVLGLRVGQALDLRSLRQQLGELRRAYREAGYLRVSFGKPWVEELPGTSPRGILHLPVQAGPRIRLRVEGNGFLSSGEALEALALPADEPLTQTVAQEAARRLEVQYHRLGFPRAQVKVRERLVRPGLLQIVFDVVEGKPLRVRRIVFPGAKQFTQEALRDVVCEAMASKQPPLRMRLDPNVVRSFGDTGVPADARRRAAVQEAPDPCTVFDEPTYEEAGRRIAEMYVRRGWLSVKVGEPRVVQDGADGTVSVALPIDEGVQTLVADVSFDGAREFGTQELLGISGLALGTPLSYLDVEEARFRLLQHYQEHAHPFVRIEPRFVFDPTKTSAHIHFDIDEGPKVRVGRIIVRGHRRTSAALVRSRLTLRPGEPWNIREVRRSQRRLLELGIYRSAVLRLLDADNPARTMDAVVVVDERAPMSLELGIGLSTEDGPRTFAEFTHYAMPFASELDARFKANYPIFDLGPAGLVSGGPEWAAHVGINFPLLWNARTDLVWERDNRPAYSLTRLAWSVGIDRKLLGPVGTSLVAEVEFDDLAAGRIDPRQIVLTQQDRERLRLEKGQTLLSSLRPGLTLDLRDNRLNPKSGFLATATLDWSHDLGIGKPIHFLKATAVLSGYVPAARRVTLALSARGGRVFPLSEDNVTIGPKRFYLGGGDSLRGFPVDSVLPEDQRRDLRRAVASCRQLLVRDACSPDILAVIEGDRPLSVGGQTFVLVKSELRFPIWKSLKGGVFVDVGNLWEDESRIDLLALRTAAGAGIRVDTPVGPIAFDVGVNLAPDPLLNEKPVDFHLRIGLF